MAVDRVMAGLEEVDGVFRAYSWARPCVSFGYRQHYEAVSAQSCSIPSSNDVSLWLQRRESGGGIVDHRNDWTYSLFLAEGLGRCRPCDLYRRVHGVLGDVLGGYGVVSRLSEGIAGSRAEVCFEAPTLGDLVDVLGRKLAGAAMKRIRGGTLIQGSLVCSELDRVDKGKLATDFSGALFRELGDDGCIAEVSSTELLGKAARDGLVDWFRSSEWNRLR